MPIRVDIDPSSGFCGGVIRAISTAERFLDESEGAGLSSLGAIVHNEAELERLSSKGMQTISLQQLADIQDDSASGDFLLIRAHGEPPSTYSLAESKGFKVLDCTCPVVLKLQQSIAEAYRRVHSDGRKGQIVIFGKEGHAEVLGLLGQVNGDAVVVSGVDRLRQHISDGKVALEGPVEVFSQTTMSPAEYAATCSVLEESMALAHELTVERFKGTGLLTVHDTICKQVSSRNRHLSQFAANHDIIVFVSGTESSNGKVLCNLCRSMNIRTYHVTGPENLRREWFRGDDNVGVCGATSTPKWLLESVSQKILQII